MGSTGSHPPLFILEEHIRAQHIICWVWGFFFPLLIPHFSISALIKVCISSSLLHTHSAHPALLGLHRLFQQGENSCPRFLWDSLITVMCSSTFTPEIPSAPALDRHIPMISGTQLSSSTQTCSSGHGQRNTSAPSASPRVFPPLQHPFPPELSSAGTSPGRAELTALPGQPCSHFPRLHHLSVEQKPRKAPSCSNRGEKHPHKSPREAEDRAASAGSEVCTKEQKFLCSPAEARLKVKVGRGWRVPRLPGAERNTKKPSPSVMKYKFICFSSAPTSLPGSGKNYFNAALAGGFRANLVFNQLKTQLERGGES